MALNKEELYARQGEIKSRLAEIDAEHQDEFIPPESDAGQEWSRLNDEYESNQKTIEQKELREKRLQELKDNPENTESGADFQVGRPGVSRGSDIYDLTTIRGSYSNPEESRRELHDRAKRSIETSTYPLADVRTSDATRPTKEECQGHVERLLARHDTEDGLLARRLLTTGNPIYRRAFGKAALSRPLSGEEQRVLSLTTTEGGFAVPYTLDPTIIPTSNSSINPFRAISRIETLVGSNEWRGVSSGAITSTYVAEGTEATDNSVAVAQPTATVQRAQCFIPFSMEIGEDWGALESEMARLIQDSKDDLEATQFAIGVGTTVFPQGVAVGTTNTVAAATGLTVTAANLYALEAALPPRFRPNEVFVGNRGIYNIIRNIDTAGGAALWLYLSQGLVNQVPTPGNTGALLLGRPAYESSAMQATVVNATKILIVGDFSYYLIVDRIGLSVDLIPHLFGGTANYPTGQRGLYARWRNTAKVLSAAAFRALTGTT